MATTISFITTFDLSSASKLIIPTDTTNWAGQGIATANVNGCFTITAPSGTVIYNNTDFSDANCDIWIDNDLQEQQTITLPLVGSVVEPGVYTIKYSVYDKNLLVTYTVTNTYTYSYIAPVVCIQNTVDCITPRFTSLDATNYVVNGITPDINRVHRIYYPAGNVDSATYISGIEATLMTGVFYQGCETSTVSSTLTYVFADGLTVIDIVKGVLETDVDCTFICSIYCCIQVFKNRMQNFKGVNNSEYLRLSNIFQQISSFVILAQLAIQCGEPDDVNGYLTEIQGLSECTSNCSCSGDAPTRVTGLGGIVDQVIVQGGGSPVEVTGNTVGNVTTYTISLSNAFINIVNNSYNTIVAAGDNITVSVATAVDGTKTYTVNGLKTIVTASNGIKLVATGPTAGVTTYALSLEANGESTSALSQSITTNVFTTITGCTFTPPTVGTYNFQAELVLGFLGTVNCEVQYHADGVAIGLSRIFLQTTASANSQTYCINEKLTLTAAQVVTLKIRNVTAAEPITVKSQSLQYLKIA